MTEQQLVTYFTTVNCSLFKETRYNTLVFRNNKTGKKASISKCEDYVPISICALCKSLKVQSPEHFKEHGEMLEAIIKHSDNITPTGGHNGFGTMPSAQA